MASKEFKDSLVTSPTWGRLSDPARVLFVSLVVSSDTHGRLKGDLDTLRSVTPREWSTELLVQAVLEVWTEESIELYMVGGRWYLLVVNHDLYQRRIVGRRRGASIFPAPLENLGGPHGGHGDRTRAMWIQAAEASGVDARARAGATENRLGPVRSSSENSENHENQPLAATEVAAGGSESDSQIPGKVEQLDPAPRELREIVAKVCDGDWKTTRSSRRQFNTACRELHDAGATGAEVERRAQVYRLAFSGRILTPKALAANWGLLDAPLPSSSPNQDDGGDDVDWARYVHA